MRKSKFSDEQIVGVLAQEAAGTVTGAELCRQHSIGCQTLPGRRSSATSASARRGG